LCTQTRTNLTWRSPCLLGAPPMALHIGGLTRLGGDRVRRTRSSQESPTEW